MPPWFPTMGMCGPAALAPRGPRSKETGGHVGNCPDGGGAGTKAHEQAGVTGCLWPAPNWWVVQPGVSRGWDLRGPPPFFCGGRCVFEFAPRTGTSVAPAIAAETVRLVETKKMAVRQPGLGLPGWPGCLRESYTDRSPYK